MHAHKLGAPTGAPLQVAARQQQLERENKELKALADQRYRAVKAAQRYIQAYTERLSQGSDPSQQPPEQQSPRVDELVQEGAELVGAADRLT